LLIARAALSLCAKRARFCLYRPQAEENLPLLDAVVGQLDFLAGSVDQI
jgi:hypothetical protein